MAVHNMCYRFLHDYSVKDDEYITRLDALLVGVEPERRQPYWIFPMERDCDVPLLPEPKNVKASIIGTANAAEFAKQLRDFADKIEAVYKIELAGGIGPAYK